MLGRILAFSVRQRWLVVLATVAAAVSGAWSLTKLPIDAVPDVTNVQVQINGIAPALTPIEIEKQVSCRLKRHLPAPRASNPHALSRATASPRSRQSSLIGRTSTLRVSRWPSA